MSPENIQNETLLKYYSLLVVNNSRCNLRAQRPRAPSQRPYHIGKLPIGNQDQERQKTPYSLTNKNMPIFMGWK
jgi:hypothetical protein